MVWWHHRLSGHEFEQTLRDSEGQGSLACCSPWGCKELDMTYWLNNNKIPVLRTPLWGSLSGSTKAPIPKYNHTVDWTLWYEFCRMHSLSKSIRVGAKEELYPHNCLTLPVNELSRECPLSEKELTLRSASELCMRLGSRKGRDASEILWVMEIKAFTFRSLSK